MVALVLGLGQLLAPRDSGSPPRAVPIASSLGPKGDPSFRASRAPLSFDDALPAKSATFTPACTLYAVAPRGAAPRRRSKSGAS